MNSHRLELLSWALSAILDFCIQIATFGKWILFSKQFGASFMKEGGRWAESKRMFMYVVALSSAFKFIHEKIIIRFCNLEINILFFKSILVTSCR
jgi:hypothetical protein